jgi:hypothetical protein
MKANNYGRLKAGAIYSMLLGKASLADGATGATAPNTNSNGQQVFASIKNPVIVNETTMYGDQLRVLKSADIVFPAGPRRNTSATRKASTATAPRPPAPSSTWTASGASTRT